MRPPVSIIHLLILLFALSLLMMFVYMGALSLAFEKLGLSKDAAFVLLFGSLMGSGLNIPLFTIEAEPPVEMPPRPSPWGPLQPPLFTGKTIIAVNVGGGIIPVAFSLYLLSHQPIPAMGALVATAITTTASYLFSRPIPGLGVGMPILVAPVTAALVAMVIDPEHSAPLAYICGTLGVLLGADLLHLPDIRRLGAPVASIGGAGTFDGIFLTGIVAVLLA